MSIREEREAAFWPLWRRWGDEPRDFAALLLDALDEIDAARRPAEKRPDGTPGDDAVKAWIEANPDWFADWAATQARISGTAATSREPRPARPSASAAARRRTGK